MRGTFDYSALHVISQWLLQYIAGAHADFSVVDRHVDALSEILSLNSGVGLSEIWASLSHRGASMRDTDKIRQLNAAAQRLPHAAKGKCVKSTAQTMTKVNLSGLREDIFQLLALLTLPVPLGDEERAVLDTLVLRLESVSTHLHNVTHNPQLFRSNCPTSGRQRQTTPPRSSTLPTLRFS